MLKFLDLNFDMFGIDISDSAVKVLKLKKKRGYFKVEFINEVDINSGIVQEGVIIDELALSDLIKKSLSIKNGRKIKTKYVVASLPEEKSFLQVIQMPKMEQKELESAVLYQAENYIPLPLDKVYADFQVIDSKENLNHINVLVIAMPKTTVDSYFSCLKRSGLVPVVLEVESQSIVRVLIKNEESKSPIILVNYGKKNSNIIIFSARSIRFTSSVTASSNQITEAIAKEFSISEQEAEQIKTSFSLLDKDKDEKSARIYKAIYPILEELIMQIKKYISFYKDHILQDKDFLNHTEQLTDKEKIIITGGGSNLKGLSEFIEKEISIKTEIGNVLSNLKLNKKSQNNFINGKGSSFCTSIGLAIRAVNNYD